jgi:PRTRC genetic system protein E
MFTELHAMAKAAMLLITATAEGDQLRISITPSYPDGKVPAGATALRPLAVVGTPDELNEDFAAVLNLWQAPKLSVLEQAQAQVAELDDDADTQKATGKAVTKASDAKSKTKSTRKSAPAAPADTSAQPGDEKSGEAAVPVDVHTLDIFTQPASVDDAGAQPSGEGDEAAAPVDVPAIDIF